MGLIGLLAGCAGPQDLAAETADTAASPCGVEAPDALHQLTIGTGEDVFEALQPGDEVPIIYGPQGGWHVWLGLRASHLEKLTTIRAVLIETESQQVVSETVNRVGLEADEELSCQSSFAGLVAYLDVDELTRGACDTPPELLHEREVCIQMEAEDMEGSSASSELCVQTVRSQSDPTRLDYGC